MPAHLQFENGGESVALIPTRYPDSEKSDDGLILLFRTEPGWIEWQTDAGATTYNVYQGDLSVLRATGEYTQAPGSNALAERACAIEMPEFLDPDNPPAGEVQFALVGGVSSGVEGGLGTNSAGVPRANTHPCP